MGNVDESGRGEKERLDISLLTWRCTLTTYPFFLNISKHPQQHWKVRLADQWQLDLVSEISSSPWCVFLTFWSFDVAWVCPTIPVCSAQNLTIYIEIRLNGNTSACARRSRSKIPPSLFALIIERAKTGFEGEARIIPRKAIHIGVDVPRAQREYTHVLSCWFLQPGRRYRYNVKSRTWQMSHIVRSAAGNLVGEIWRLNSVKRKNTTCAHHYNCVHIISNYLRIITNFVFISL